jgi:hypothetical protein
MRRRTAILIGVVLAVASGWGRVATAADIHVGWIENIGDSCRGQWRASDSARPVKLDQKKDHYRFLYSGESVRCEGSGTMSLQILDKKKEISKRNGWYRIRDVSVNANLPQDEIQRLSAQEKAVMAFGRPAGRQRGLPSPIFCPAAESTVRADELVFRWNEIPGATRIILRLSDKYHLVLWEQADVDARRGQLVSPAGRTALVAYGDRGGAGPFSFILTNGGVEQPVVQFSILSTEEQRALEKDLQNCEKSKGLSGSVCRTYAFSTREMWNNAADEYEAALKLEPDSQDLLVAALKAEMSIGNTRRVSELQAKLPAGKAVPE